MEKRSYNPYIMGKMVFDLNEKRIPAIEEEVGQHGIDISILGSQNESQERDITEIKDSLISIAGSLNSMNSRVTALEQSPGISTEIVDVAIDDSNTNFRQIITGKNVLKVEFLGFYVDSAFATGSNVPSYGGDRPANGQFDVPLAREAEFPQTSGSYSVNYNVVKLITTSSGSVFLENKRYDNGSVSVGVVTDIDPVSITVQPNTVAKFKLYTF